MKVIVIDNNTQEIIVYTITKKDKKWMKESTQDLSEIIEEMICNQEHNLSEVSWMILSDEFEIKFKEM